MTGGDKKSRVPKPAGGQLIHQLNRGADQGTSAQLAGAVTGASATPTGGAPKERSVSYRSGSVGSDLASKFAGINFVNSEVFSECPSGGLGSKSFPPAYNIIRAGKAMRLNTGRLGTVSGFDRVPSKLGYCKVGIAGGSDSRETCAQNYHCLEKGLNLSLSIGKPGAGGVDHHGIFAS